MKTWQFLNHEFNIEELYVYIYMCVCVCVSFIIQMDFFSVFNKNGEHSSYKFSLFLLDQELVLIYESFLIGSTTKFCYFPYYSLYQLAYLALPQTKQSYQDKILLYPRSVFFFLATSLRFASMSRL